MEDDEFLLSQSQQEKRITSRLLTNIIDLNESPMEEGDNDRINESTTKDKEIVVVDKDEGEFSKENDNSFEPVIGQCFLSEQEAYTFYANFARRSGFSVRKGRFTTKKDGRINRRDFFCHREGFVMSKIVDSSKNQRNRESWRCGCKARMRITLKRALDIFPEEWHITKFVSDHNHELLATAQVCFLPAYRTISKEDEQQILLYKEAGLKVRQIIRVMVLEKSLKHGDLPFLHKDIYNLFNKIRQEKVENDAMNLLEHCKSAKNRDNKFQYAFTVDENNRLEHIFWAPAHCFEWYQDYGDAVAFDTTYKVNYYDMPFAIFVGIDNHDRTILFGCALLRNETVATFHWLMKTFTTFMRKPPKTIIIDQDASMTQAIEVEMPSTKHAFCIWHITTKFSGWFTSILRTRYEAWCTEFYRLYRLDDIDDFEREWPLTILKFDLQSNKHVIGLYKVKKFWVPAYLCGHFFGGMTTTGRSESINSFVKRFTSSRSSLPQLTDQVGLAIEEIGNTHLHHTMLDTYRGSCLRTLSPLEEQVHGAFTKFAFKKFQEQFERATQYKVQRKDCATFIVQYFKEQNSRRHQVLINGDAITCSCQHFEFWGILCRHILSVFLHEDRFEIPERYLPLRWCHDESHKGENGMIVDDTSEETQNINVDAGVDDFVHCPPVSVTKGRPKTKRMRSGKELAKQVRLCSYCKKFGHNITRCPNKENPVLSLKF